MNQRRAKPSTPADIDLSEATLVGLASEETTVVGASAVTQSGQPPRESSPAPQNPRPPNQQSPRTTPPSQAPSQQRQVAPERRALPPPALQLDETNEDVDRTIVEQNNPLKEAFDARTLVNSDPPKRFDFEKTQVPEGTGKTTLKPLPKITMAAREETTQIKFPDSPRFGSSSTPAEKPQPQRKPLPEAAARAQEPVEYTDPSAHLTTHQDKQKVKSRSEKNSKSRSTKADDHRQPEGLEADHDRSHKHAREEEYDDEHSEGQIPHVRKPSPLSIQMQRLAAKLRDLPTPDFRSPRFRNAAVATIVVMIGVFVWVKHSSSPGAPGRMAQSDMASENQESDNGSAASARSGKALGGQTVKTWLQVFDQSFAKTQDQR